jgi:phosphotransferase system IIA component
MPIALLMHININDIDINAYTYEIMINTYIQIILSQNLLILSQTFS